MPRITDIQRIKDALTAAPGKKLYTTRIAELLGKRTDLVYARLTKATAIFHVNKDGMVTFRRAPRKAKAEQDGQEQLALPYQDVPEYTSEGVV
jgi:hypothetical protein